MLAVKIRRVLTATLMGLPEEAAAVAVTVEEVVARHQELELEEEERQGCRNWRRK